MSYAPALSYRSVSGLGDAALVCPVSFKKVCPNLSDPNSCTCQACLEPKAWAASQKACNAQGGAAASTDPSDPCTLANLIATTAGGICAPPSDDPSGYPPSPCPPGQTMLGERVPRQSKTGAWGTVTVSYCASSIAPAVAAQTYKKNWGLILGLGIAAVVVYKVAVG